MCGCTRLHTCLKSLTSITSSNETSRNFADFMFPIFFQFYFSTWNISSPIFGHLGVTSSQSCALKRGSGQNSPNENQWKPRSQYLKQDLEKFYEITFQNIKNTLMKSIGTVTSALCSSKKLVLYRQWHLLPVGPMVAIVSVLVDYRLRLLRLWTFAW